MAEMVRAAAPREWQLAGINFQWIPEAIINIKLISDESAKDISIMGVEAVTLIRQVDTSNNSVKSLHKRIYEYLISKGHITGEVIGAPD